MLSKSLRHKAYTAPQGDKQRLRLLSWPTILTFTVLIVAVMALLFPRTRLIEEVVQSKGEDPLSRQYLLTLIKNDPDNGRLQIKRVLLQLEANQLQDAEQLIQELQRQDDADLRIPLAYAMLRLREQQTFSHPAGSSLRQRAMPALHQALAALGKLPLDHLSRQALAEKAAAYGATDLAFQLYRGLANSESASTRVRWIEQAAKLAQSHGRYREAATLYFEARHLDPELSGQKRRFQAGVRALQAGNLPAEALSQAEAQLGNLANEPDMLLFMVRLALAANHNDRAEFYVRKLLRYAELGGQLTPAIQQVSESVRPMEAAILSDALELSHRLPSCEQKPASPSCWTRLPSHAPQRAAALKPVSAQPQLPFDDEIYRLGYDVFLANRNISNAYIVATAAVRQAPDNAAWRERLAKVAEWNGQPAIALEQWRYLAQRNNSEAAWQAMLRLAPGLFDEETVIIALTHEYQNGRLDDTRLLRLVQAFEATGEARQGVTFLVQAYAKTSRRIMLEQQAWLEERLGMPDAAIASLQKLDRKHGLKLAEINRLAALHIAKGDLAAAYQTLQDHQSAATRQDRTYQALMAELAWRLQDTNTAKRIYQALYAKGPLEAYEAERLITLLRKNSPDAAARLAARYWNSTRQPNYLYIALELYTQTRNWTAAEALLASLSATDLVAQEQQPQFLQIRSDLHRANGRLELAIADMQQAIRIQPADLRLHAQLLWLVIEARDIAQLKTLLAQHHPRALNQPVLWGPVGAGFALLADARNALPYYARQAAAHRDDYLWQVGYAQVLEEARQADMAWRIRRHAWLNLKRTGTPNPEQHEQWQAMAALALRLAPGDAGAQWLRESLRLDLAGQTGQADSTDKPQYSPEAKELATAWYLSSEHYESARLWLTRQYGKQLQAPGWAEAALALQGNDKVALKRIAEGGGEGITPEVRVDAALQLREYALARKLAEAGLDITPDNDVLHLQLTESVWQQHHRVGGGYRVEELGALKREGWQLNGQWSVKPHLKMGLELSEERLSSRDAGRLVNPPNSDRRLTLSGRLAHEQDITSLKLFYRNAHDAFAGLQLDHELRIDRRLRITGTLGYQVDADENDVLSAGGMKNTLKLSAEWLISKRDYLLADLSTSRYSSQDRATLGNGTGFTFQLGHHFRTEYPDFTVKLLGSAYRFSDDRTTNSSIHTLLVPGAAAMPDSYNQFGFGFSIGETVNEQFSRTFRPYALFDVLNGSNAGWGYGTELGFVFSPTGQDWLRGRYRKGQSTFGNDQDSTLLDLEYRYLF